MTELTEVRLDVWLYAARFFRSRGLARGAIEGGRVAINGQAVGKPARLLRVADQIKLRRGDDEYEIEVLALSDQRGPAAVAQLLYRETDAGRARREAEAERRRLERSGYQPPESRPNKKARRLLRALGDFDAW